MFTSDTGMIKNEIKIFIKKKTKKMKPPFPHYNVISFTTFSLLLYRN